MPGRHSGATKSEGGEPPSFFFFLGLPPRWEEGSPSGPWSPWRRRGESPSEIGYISLSLYVSALSYSALAPFLLYLEIRNSDWIETFAQIFFQKLAFFRPKKSANRLARGPQGLGAPPVGAGAPLPRGHLGHHLALILPPKIHIYSKKNP